MRTLVLLVVLLFAQVAEATTTYYVAINQPGADNAACDGLYPVNRPDLGAGHCPFKDFTSITVRNKLIDAVDVRMVIRDGTYTLTSLEDAIVVAGAGSSFAEATVLVNYPGETPMFDGANTAREVIRITGQYTIVQGLILQNAGAYNIEVRGGNWSQILNNTLLQNFSSDSLKGDGGASDILVQGNVFRGWSSQGIDLAGVARWTVTRNVFGRPASAASKCVGMKFEAIDVTVSQNVFSDCSGVAMGGVSSPHDGAWEASGLIVEQNAFISGGGFLFDAYSCQNCAFRNNNIYGGAYGGRLAGIATQGESGCNAGAGGCTATTNFTLSGNVVRSLAGASGNPGNIFMIVDSTELTGMSAIDNTYCLLPGDSTVRFAYNGSYENFAAWQAHVSSDTLSRVNSAGVGQCGAKLRKSRIR